MQDQNNFIQSAKKCIETEITGLKSLLDFFGDDYINAINLIINCQGKIIISGMGKSGHIASKIAAPCLLPELLLSLSTPEKLVTEILA